MGREGDVGMGLKTLHTASRLGNPSDVALNELGLAINVVRDFNASGSAQSTTGSISAGSNVLSLASAIDFKNGQGIYIEGASKITDPTSPLSLSQVSGGTAGINGIPRWISSNFTANEVIYVTYAFKDPSGGLTKPAPVSNITISTAGNIITGNVNLPPFASLVLYVGTTSTPLELAELPGDGIPIFSGGATAGVWGYPQGRTLNFFIYQVATSTGAAQPTSNNTAIPLVSTIQSGAGTTSLVLANSAQISVTSANVYHDDSVAINNAAQAAKNNGSYLYFPPGTFRISSGKVLFDSINIKGAGPYTIILATKMANGEAAIDLITSNYAPINVAGTNQRLGELEIGNFSLFGSTSTQNIGTIPVNYHGIREEGQTKYILRNILVSGFYHGIEFLSYNGHVMLDSVTATQNYFGVYYLRNNQDYLIINSDLSGNNLAGIGCNEVFDGASFTNIFRSHLGFQPVGIYQQSILPGSLGQAYFLVTSNLDRAQFESVGNAAIYSEVAISNPNGGNIRNLYIKQCSSASFGNSQYKLSTISSNYAIWIPMLSGTVWIYNDESGFTQGAVNVIYLGGVYSVSNAYAGIVIVNASANTTTSALSASCITPASGLGYWGLTIIDGRGVSTNWKTAGLQTAPSIPTSGTALTNPFPFTCRVYVSGGTVSAIAINGTATGLSSGEFMLAPGETITLTYSAAPTWKWFGM